MSYPDVRRAQKSDQAVVGDLWIQLLQEQEELDDRLGVADDARERWANDFPVWIDDDTRRVYVAEAEGEVAGFLSARRWGPPPIYEGSPEVYLDELFVRPSQRRQGLGTQLLAALRDWTGRIGARRIRLRVLTRNDEAQAFWADQGARPFTTTLTLERAGQKEKQDDEGSEKIGF